MANPTGTKTSNQSRMRASPIPQLCASLLPAARGPALRKPKSRRELLRPGVNSCELALLDRFACRLSTRPPVDEAAIWGWVHPRALRIEIRPCAARASLNAHVCGRVNNLGMIAAERFAPHYIHA